MSDDPVVILNGPDGPVLLSGVAFEATLTESQEVEAGSPSDADPHASSPAADSPQPPETQTPSERVTSTKPEDATWDEWHRRQETVRTMAREFDAVDHGDIREFIKGRTTRELTDDEVGQLRHDILSQRVSDITDILDEQLRSTVEQMRRSRRTVRVQAPRGWMRRAFGSLDERAAGQVVARLIDRGHDPEVIKDKVLSRVKDEEVRNAIIEKLDKGELKIEFSNPLHGIPYGLAQQVGFSHEQAMEFALEMAETIAQNVKVPEVHVEVPINMGGNKKRIVRGEDGLVTEVVEE